MHKKKYTDKDISEISPHIQNIIHKDPIKTEDGSDI